MAERCGSGAGCAQAGTWGLTTSLVRQGASMTTARSRDYPTLRAPMPDLPNLSARPRAKRVAALPNLPDLSGSRAYSSNRRPSSHYINPYRLDRLGRLGKRPGVAVLWRPNLSPTWARSGAAVGQARCLGSTGRDLGCGTCPVERGSSQGGTFLRAASARFSRSFCLNFLVNFNGLRVKGFRERLK